VLLFVVQQLYMLVRMWLKANFYASQTRLYRTTMLEHHAAGVPATQPAT
jgi:hypothetical protein